jgi:hypothetical protein
MLYFQARAAPDVLDRLIEISADKNLARPKELTASFSLPHLEFKKAVEGKLPGLLEELKGHATQTASIAVPTSIELSFEHWSLKFDLPVKEAWWTAQPNPKSRQAGQAAPPLTADQVNPWLLAIVQKLSAHPDRPQASLAPAQAREAVEANNAAARRMETVAANITDQLGKVAIERDTAFTKKSEQLEASIAAQRDQLSRERIQFEQEKAERDSREATVVRRQLLKETLQELDEETSVVLSKETNQKRLAIGVALGSAMLLGVGLIVATVVVEIQQSVKNAEALVLLRSLAVSGVVLFGSSLWYFVRWQDHWQQTHATAELQNRKNRKDMLRASWLAELIIETGKLAAGKDTKVQLPDTLLEGMAHGLFVAPEEATVTEHPLEVLFKRARLDRLKLSKTGIELTKQPRAK